MITPEQIKVFDVVFKDFHFEVVFDDLAYDGVACVIDIADHFWLTKSHLLVFSAHGVRFGCRLLR